MPRSKTPVTCVGYDATKTKRCSECEEDRPRTEEHWGVSARNRDGLLGMCRPCQNAYTNEWKRGKRKANPEHYRLQHMAWLNNHPGYTTEANRKRSERRWAYMLVSNADRSNRSGGRRSDSRGLMEVSITEEDVLRLYARQQGVCHWFGIKMVPSAVKREPRRPSLDRLDCSKGYTLDNVVLTCMAANMGRSDCSADEYREACMSLPRALTGEEIVDTEI